MKLLVDLPAGWPPQGVSFRVDALRPLPLSLEAWRDASVYRGVDRSAVRVVAAVDRQTKTGWPVALVVTEIGPTRRLHAFFRFLVHGCVVVLEAEARAFDAVMEQAKDLLLAARPDFATEKPVAVRDLWAGFDAGETR